MPKLRLAVDNGKKHINNMTQEELTQAQTLAYSLPFNERSVFLEKMLAPAVSSFGYDITSPEWLLSDFDDVEWNCLFGKRKRQIDFRVRLENNSLLTDGVNAKFLYTIKYFLCAQTHPRFNAGNRLVPTFSAEKVSRAKRFVDYVLLRGKHFRTAEFGFGLLTNNDLKVFMHRFQAGGVSEGVYDYSHYMTSHLRKIAMGISDTEVQKAIQIHPSITKLPVERYLKFEDDELIRIKTWMHDHGVFNSPKGNKYRALKLRPAVYDNTLGGKAVYFPMLPELLTEQHDSREFEAVPVHSETSEGVGERMVSYYRAMIQSLYVISSDEFSGVSANALDDFNTDGQRPNSGSANAIKRNRSLPAGVVFKAIRDGFEFTFQYAEAILATIPALLKQHATYSGQNPLNNLNSALPDILPSSLSEAGVIQWYPPESQRFNERFGQLRTNKSLLDLYEVMMGSIQIIIGVLMARRVAELMELKPDCLAPKQIDPNTQDSQKIQFQLTFENRKSGAQGDRESLSRPIPRSAAKLIWALQQFRLQLIEYDIISTQSPLLVGFTGSNGAPRKISNYVYRGHLDRFCDYFQTQTVTLAEGDVRRYYIRQHQLRRFFAMAFFWGSGYDGMDTLRWFLGHTDAEHLWHYITENTSGVVLRGVKAEKMVHGLNNDEIQGIERLRELLKERFGVDDLTIQSLSDVIDDYEGEAEAGYVVLNPELDVLKQELSCNVELLLKEGTIDLEPTFATVISEDGKSMQKITLVLRVKETDDD